MCVCARLHMSIHTCIYMYMYTHTRTQTHTRTHTHIHTHTHTHTQVSFSSSDDAHGLLARLGPLGKLPMFAFVEAFKAMVSNVDRAPIVLHNVTWDRPFLPHDELVTRLVKHYTHDVMYALLHLVGSLDVLGNPLGLVTNLSQGVTGFMDHTGSGIRDLRQGHLSAMGKDLALGAASLAAGTVQGVFGSASSLSHAMVKGMAQLTFDGDYKRARALMEQERPSHFAQGLLQGGKHLGRGVVLGVTGIFTQPVKGFSKHGARGALKGVGKGLVGVVVKPVAGVVDMVAFTTEGIRNTPEYLAKAGVVTRVRQPRLWPAGSPVRAFDRRAALGFELFARLCMQEDWLHLVSLKPLPHPPAVVSPGREAGGGEAAGRALARERRKEHLWEHAAWHDGVLGPVVLFLTSKRLILCVQRRDEEGADALPLLSVKAAIALADLRQIHVMGSSIRLLTHAGSPAPRLQGQGLHRGLSSWRACFGGSSQRGSAGKWLDDAGKIVRQGETEIERGGFAGCKEMLRLRVGNVALRRWLVEQMRFVTSACVPEASSNAHHPRRGTCPPAASQGGGSGGSGGGQAGLTVRVVEEENVAMQQVVDSGALARMQVEIRRTQVRGGRVYFAIEVCLLPAPVVPGVGGARPGAAGGRGAGAEVEEEDAASSQWSLHEGVGDGMQWTVYKRYSDFDRLRRRLSSGTAGGGMWTLPELPRKRWRKTAPDVVHERIVGLKQFLQEITKVWLSFHGRIRPACLLACLPACVIIV